MIKNKKNENTGSEAMLSGEFGESFIAYLLCKEGINVVRASTIGFDLFAIDLTGKIFPKNKMVGISVKARVSKSHNRFVPTIPLGSEKIKASMKIWNVDAYMGIVVGSKNKKLSAFLVPFKDIIKFRGKAKRADVLATSELYANKNLTVKELF